MEYDGRVLAWKNRVADARATQQEFLDELTDQQFLRWVRNRAVNRWRENPESLWMRRLEEVIQRTEKK